MAAVETPQDEIQETDATRITGGTGGKISLQWTWPLVERRSLAYEQSLWSILLQKAGIDTTDSPAQPLSVFNVNRRVRNRTHGGVGGRRE